MNKKMLLALGGLLAAGLVLLGAFFLLNPAALHGTLIDPPKQVANLTLQADAGPFSLGNLHGKLVILFFGYTNCPDTCPITMGKLATVFNRLGSDAGQVQVVMVTVDPERDTPAVMHAYAQNFNPGFIGLSGSKEEIAAVADEFGIYYKKVAGNSPEAYSMDHTASIMVLDRQGRIRLVWPNEIQPADITSDLRTLLREQ